MENTKVNNKALDSSEQSSKFKHHSAKLLTRKRVLYVQALILIVTFLLVSVSGILKIYQIYFNLNLTSEIGEINTVIHDWSGLFFGVLIFIHILIHWRWFLGHFQRIIKRKSLNKPKKSKLLLAVSMIISFSILVLTGLIKLPILLTNPDQLYQTSFLLVLVHDISGFFTVILLTTHVILHRKWLIGTSKRLIDKSKALSITVISLIVLLISVIVIPPFFSNNTPEVEEYIYFEGIDRFSYNPAVITTIRPDIFREGHFSVFDILVDLDNRGKINMDYHFESSKNTYIIDSINEMELWRYYAYYDGGWKEDSVFRLDHYPYKPKMSIRMFQTSSGRAEGVNNMYEREISRLESNNGTVIIPQVFIRTPSERLEFQNIVVTPHNLRNDFFQEDVITAIDVIMSLGDFELITYELNWYEEIGNAEIKNYYVDEINGHRTYARCGFVYESGDFEFDGFRGNHIHIPADIRTINSPEYVEWFWICI